MPAKVLEPTSLATLTTATWRAIASAQDGDPLAPVLVLAGSNTLATFLARDLALQGHPVAGVRFITFQDLALRLTAGRLRGAPISGLEATLLAGEAIQPVWEPDQDSARFALAGAAKQAFDRLRNGGVPPDPPRAADDPGSVLALFADFQARLNGRIDAGARFRAAIGLAPEATEPLIVAGIYSVNALQRDLVCAWGGSVHWLLPFTDREHPRIEALVRDLAARGFASSPATHPPAPRTLLGAILDYWPAAPDSPVARDNTVDLLSATDDALETREAIRLALAWCDRTARPLRDVAIVARGPDRLASVMEELLALEVPFTGNRPLPSTNTGIALSHALLLLEGETTRTTVFDFLARSAPQHLRQLAGGTPDVAYWADLAGRAGIAQGDRDRWEAHLKAHRAEMAAEAGEDSGGWQAFEIEQTDRLLAVLARLFDDLDPGRVVDTPAKWSATLQRLLAWLPEEHVAPGTRPVAEAVEAVLGTIARLERPFLPLPLFLVMAREALASATLPSGRFQDRGLWVGTADAIRGLRFGLVVLVGMSERGFPLVSSAQPLLDDDTVHAINTALGTGIETSTDRRQLEELLFLQVVAAARDTLVLSWPRSDDADERTRLPSWYVQRVAELTTDGPVPLEDLEHHPLTIRTDLATPSRPLVLLPEEYDLAAIRTEARDRRVPGYLWTVLPRFAATWDASHARRPWEPFSAWDGVLADPSALDPFLDRLQRGGLAPTAIERFTGCPHQFFLASVLRLRPPQEPDQVDEISPLDRGTVLHSILEQAVKDWMTSGSLQELPAIAQRVFAEAERQGLTGMEGLWARNRAAILEDVAAYLRRDFDGWRPVATEVSFGPGKEWPAVAVGSGRPLTFRGQIDRVDRDAQGRVRVVDYKTGRSTPRTDVTRGKKVQLPIYLAAAMRATGATEGTASYHFLTRRGGYTDVEIDSTEAASIQSILDETVDTMMEAAAEGQFPPMPGSPCRFCDYQTICGTAIGRRIPPKRDYDPRIDALFTALGSAPS